MISKIWAFQELSRGMVNLNNLRKIKDIAFPFPYEQMIQILLIIHTTVTPFLACHLVKDAGLAAITTFLICTSMWSVLYIAREIEQPFGEDHNDFNVEEMQQVLNQTLLTLVHPLAQKAPGLPAHDFALVSSNEHIVGAGHKGTEAPREGRQSMNALNRLQSFDAPTSDFYNSQESEEAQQEASDIFNSAAFSAAPTLVPGKQKGLVRTMTAWTLPKSVVRRRSSRSAPSRSASSEIPDSWRAIGPPPRVTQRRGGSNISQPSTTSHVTEHEQRLTVGPDSWGECGWPASMGSARC